MRVHSEYHISCEQSTKIIYILYKQWLQLQALTCVEFFGKNNNQNLQYKLALWCNKEKINIFPTSSSIFETAS